MSKNDNIPKVMRPVMPDGTIKYSRIPIANRFILLLRYKGQCYFAHIVGRDIVCLVELFPDDFSEILVPEGQVRRLSFTDEIYTTEKFSLDKIIDSAIERKGKDTEEG